MDGAGFFCFWFWLDHLDIPRLAVGSIAALGECTNQPPAIGIDSPPATGCCIENHLAFHFPLYPPRFRISLRFKRPSKLFFPLASILVVQDLHKRRIVLGRKVALERIERHVVAHGWEPALSLPSGLPGARRRLVKYIKVGETVPARGAGRVPPSCAHRCPAP